MARRIPKDAPDREVSFKTHDGEYVVRYWDKRHTYWMLGGAYEEWTWIPSTTMISKLSEDRAGGLLPWAVGETVKVLEERLLGKGAVAEYRIRAAIDAARKAHVKKRDTAGDYGTAVHALFERLFDRKARVPDALKKQHAMLRTWAESWEIKPLESEFLVAHPGLGYAGTGDLLCFGYLPDRLGKRRLYVDLKTSTYVLPQHRAQCAGYKLAREAMRQASWDSAVILHLPRDADRLETFIADDPANDARAFEAARFLYWWGVERRSAE